MESVEELQDQLIENQNKLLKLYEREMVRANRHIEIQADLVRNQNELIRLLDGRVKELVRRLASLN